MSQPSLLLGKLDNVIRKQSWKTLLGEICNHFDHLEADLLPEDWKVSCWQVLSDNFDQESQPLIKSILKIATPSKLEQMLKSLLVNDVQDLSIWKIEMYYC